MMMFKTYKLFDGEQFTVPQGWAISSVVKLTRDDMTHAVDLCVWLVETQPMAMVVDGTENDDEGGQTARLGDPDDDDGDDDDELSMAEIIKIFAQNGGTMYVMNPQAEAAKPEPKKQEKEDTQLQQEIRNFLKKRNKQQ